MVRFEFDYVRPTWDTHKYGIEEPQTQRNPTRGRVPKVSETSYKCPARQIAWL